MPLHTPQAYVVTIDRKTLLANYKPLTDALQASYKWWHYLDNTWIILRYDSLIELQDVLVPLIFTNDRLLILPARGPAAGWMPQDAWTWIRENVPSLW